MKSLIKNITKLLVCIVLFNIGVNAQLDSAVVISDTTITTNTDSTGQFVMQKSPWGAVLRSAIFPGWGQIYNESYWKVPIVWGAMGWFVYVWIDNNNKYNDYRSLYQQYPDYSVYKKYRDFYRDQRDEFAIYFALTYVLNLVDAYVDAHLFDFSVDNNYFTGQKMISVRINF